MIFLKDYIKQEIAEKLDYCEIVEQLAEGFDVSEDEIYAILEDVEEEAAENFVNYDYYISTMSDWMMDEIRDVIKSKI